MATVCSPVAGSAAMPLRWPPHDRFASILTYEHNQHDRTVVRGFLRWCAETKLTRRFTHHPAQTRQAAPLTRARRLELLGQLLTNDDAPARSRVAASLLLL